MSERMSVKIDGGVADVRLNRPDKMNALDPEQFEGLRATGLELAKDNSLRAVVLSGEGRAFCAGLDVSSFGGLGRGGDAILTHDESSPANPAQQSAWVWVDMPVPVIAAVHGVAYGAGLQIALGADIRIEHGYVVAEAARLRGARVYLGGRNGSSVLGTANIMMAATLAEGETVIDFAACEPEIVDLANFLNAMGARVSGAGTPRIEIEGVDLAGLAQWLWNEHHFRVTRFEHDEFSGLRISPSVYTTLEELDRFVEAVEVVVRGYITGVTKTSL
jgi:hypothetical protein